MTTLWTCFDGSVHPVSGAFTAKVPADMNGVPHAVLKAELHGLFAIASADVLDGGRPLNDEERARMDAIVHVMNLNRALAFMGGRDWRELFDTLDQVHGNTIGLDCGCVLSQLFDHNKRHVPGELALHPHHAHRVCARHAAVAHDFALHHKTALADAAKKGANDGA